MARRNHLDDFTRGRMIGKLEEGRTVTSVAAEFGINKSVLSRAWKLFQTTGTAVRKVGGGRPRTTTAGDDRYIILQAKRGRRQSTSVIARQLSIATGRQVSRFTVARRLHKGGLFARRPERCLPLKVDHRRHRLQWYREHKNRTTDQWSRVLCTDESWFSTRSDSQRILTWREIETRFYTSNIKGSVIRDSYCEEVLLPHGRLFRSDIGPDFIFMDENARPHRALAVEELLESEDTTQMDWPAYSPDLNPIEHVWDALGRRIAARLHHPENTQQFKQMLIEEWALLPQEMLHQLVLSMRRRCEATIADKEQTKVERLSLLSDVIHGKITVNVQNMMSVFLDTQPNYFTRLNDTLRRKYDACRRQTYRPISKKEQAHHSSAGGKNQFIAASGKQISRKTVDRRLRGGGLYAPRPVVCVPLTRQHRTARLQWCREPHNWTEQDWACLLFSGESRFSLSSDCRRQLIWRESGTAYRPENIQEKDRYPTCSIMVWAGIMINGRTRLHVVANGTMAGQRYIDEVLLPHVRLFRGAVGDKFVFMDDNATCHRTLAVKDALGRQVAGRNYPPTNKNTLIRALTEEWDKLPQQLLDNVVQSMVRRVECCITLYGGHIPY
ncbi:transposable element Tc1 transposase [Trichonephila clavipes]|nr:transposable element Tc1 transposase [Trichonephila clavipes]